MILGIGHQQKEMIAEAEQHATVCNVRSVTAAALRCTAHCVIMKREITDDASRTNASVAKYTVLKANIGRMRTHIDVGDEIAAGNND